MPNLPVPHIPQNHPGDCLVACAAMVLDYLSIPYTYADLTKRLRIIPQVGGAFSNLRLLEADGIKVLVEQGELETLRQCLERGLPPIALVDTAQLAY